MYQSRTRGDDDPCNFPEQNLMVVSRVQSLRQIQEVLAVVERQQQCGAKPDTSIPLMAVSLMRSCLCQPEISQRRPEARRLSKASDINTVALSIPTD